MKNISSNFLLSLFVAILIFPGYSFSDVGSVSSGAVSAQHRDFLRLLYFHRPELSFSYDIRGESEEKNGPGSVEQQIFNLDVEIPYSRNTESFYTYGGGYEYRKFDVSVEETESSLADDDLLQAFYFRMGVGHFINSDLFVTGYLEPGVYSNFGDGFDEDALRLYASGMLVYRLNPGAQVLGGLKYSEDFDDTPLVPFVGVRLHDTSGKLHISLTVPFEAKLSYHFDSSSVAYVFGDVQGDKYFAHSSSFDEGFNIQVHERKIGAGVRRWFSRHISAGLEVGSTIDSHIEFKSELPSEFRTKDVEDSFYLKAELDFAF